MTRRVYLHVGPFKTGSTYIQHSLRERRPELRDLGVYCPTSHRKHRLAVMDLLDRQRRARRPADGAWDRMVRDIASWPGDVVIVSAENLSSARSDSVRRAIADLAPAEVHVLATMRDLAGLIPSFWQSNLRNRKSVTWGDFVESLRGIADADPRFGERFWRIQDVSAVLETWAESVPAERIHVVVMPPSGAPAHVLWDRFFAAVGIVRPPPPAVESPRNVSVGIDHAEALRRLNLNLQEGLPKQLYATFVKRVATRAARHGVTESRRMVLPPEDFAWVHEQSLRIADIIVGRGYQVTGDLADAVAVGPSALGAAGPYRPDDYRLDKVADILALMSAALLDHLRQQSGSEQSEDDALLFAELETAVEDEAEPPLA